MAILQFSNYQNFNQQMLEAMKTTADNFVRIGYLLKTARDTNVLEGSGYSGMGEYAEAEYGLHPDQTSRFISICEKYGNGEDHLTEDYSGYGYAKLSEMLTLPTIVARQIPKEATREEIRDLKNEIQEEKKMSDIEVLCDKKDEDPLEAFLMEYFRGNPQDLRRAFPIAKEAHDDTDLRSIPDDVLAMLAPAGVGIIVARTSEGRAMISFNGIAALPKWVSLRTNGAKDLEWSEINGYVLTMFAPFETPEAYWEFAYHEEMPEENGSEKAETEKPSTQHQPSCEAKPKKEKTIKIAPAQKRETKKPEKTEKTTCEDASEISSVAADEADTEREAAAVGINAPETASESTQSSSNRHDLSFAIDFIQHRIEDGVPAYKDMYKTILELLKELENRREEEKEDDK